MKFNTLFKAMLVSLPLLALGACSTTSESQTKATTTAGEETVPSGEIVSSGVETGSAEQILTPQEQQELKEEALRKEHVIYFDFDRSDVQPDFLELIQAHGNYLIAHPNVKVMIEGHADERGTPEYNIALGERRAKAVAKYLQSMGVLPSQITVVSFGEEKPLDLSKTDAGFAKNRRAVLVY